MSRARWVFAALLCLAALGAGYVFFTNRHVERIAPAFSDETGASPAQPPAPPTPAPLGARDAIERSALALIDAVPAYGAFFQRLGLIFPADRAAILDRFVTRAQEQKVLEPADYYVAEAIKTLRQTRGIVAGRASLPALQAVFDAQAAVLGKLSEHDPRLCVDFLYGGVTDAFLAFAARQRDLFAAMANASLNAIVDGQSRKADRLAAQDQDFADLERALLARGLARPEIEALLDGKAADPPIADARMCRAGIDYLETLKAMPEDARQRIYSLAVELMARG